MTEPARRTLNTSTTLDFYINPAITSQLQVKATALKGDRKALSGDGEALKDDGSIEGQ